MTGSASTLIDLSDTQLCDEFVKRHADNPDEARPYLKAFVARQQAREAVGNNQAYFKLLARLAKKGGAS